MLLVVVCVPYAMSESEVEQLRLEADRKRVVALTAEFGAIRTDATALRESLDRKQRGFYDSVEHEAVAAILFRFVGCREGLWDLVEAHDVTKVAHLEERHAARSLLVAFHAGTHLIYNSSSFVLMALDDEQLRGKLNEAYKKYDIPSGTYGRVFDSLTSIENIQRARAAWLLFREEVRDADSLLNRIAAEEPEYRRLKLEIEELYPVAMENVEAILEASSLMLPNVRNRLRHSEVGRVAKALEKRFHGRLYAMRGALFVNVSRLKSPVSEVVAFSPTQLKEVKLMLEPGDIILTYTAGYMSNLFLPGLFKHGMTYVGSPDQRRRAGLIGEHMQFLPETRRQAVLKEVEATATAEGHEADLIEAVAEGVIFSSLEHIMHTHVNRMVVMRPRLSEALRAKYLASVFALLGSEYDFRFDFGEATYQCCTEVIYRCMNGLGTTNFELTPRLGTPTLSADDIVNHHLAADGGVFDLVLLATHNDVADSHAAVLHVGTAAEAELRRIMAR
jgi:hypothetical protein